MLSTTKSIIDLTFHGDFILCFLSHKYVILHFLDCCPLIIRSFILCTKIINILKNITQLLYMFENKGDGSFMVIIYLNFMKRSYKVGNAHPVNSTFYSNMCNKLRLFIQFRFKIHYIEYSQIQNICKSYL